MIMPNSRQLSSDMNSLAYLQRYMFYKPRLFLKLSYRNKSSLHTLGEPLHSICQPTMLRVPAASDKHHIGTCSLVLTPGSRWPLAAPLNKLCNTLFLLHLTWLLKGFIPVSCYIDFPIISSLN